MVFCTSTITPAEGSTADSSSTARTAWKNVPPCPPYSSGISIPIRPMVEELPDQLLTKDAGFIHRAHVRADLLARKLADGGLKELFVFGERGEGRERQIAEGLPA